MTFKQPVNLTRNRNSTRILYFLRCGDYLKIGITHDLLKRVEVFKIGNPYPITLEAYRRIPAAMARQIEQSIHSDLAHAHHEGEWFKITKEEALKVAHKLTQRAARVEVRCLEQFEIRAPDVQPVISNDQDIDPMNRIYVSKSLGKG